jgi:L-seryl-tRNA(Ser) seleniumtransferase
MQMTNDPEFRRLPAVGTLLEQPAFRPVLERAGTPLVTDLLREALTALRRALVAGELSPEALAARVRPEALAAGVEAAAALLLAPRPRRVINATGVVGHTNLGRAVLSKAAAAAVAEAASGYLDLEYDLAKGARGRRMGHLEPVLARLFPGAAALVVNNNAAAVLLALRALAARREVVVSRGELVEIGGGFRVPEILAASGARLREVGTTNRTRLADYAAAIDGKKTAALLKVHPSNFHQVGFTESVEVKDLAALARERGLPLLVDWGSGDLLDLEPLGIRDERPVGALLEAGADLVTFSGDKLLGGPQAGFVVGRPELVARLARDPLARALRIDRVTLAALHATLTSYLRGTALEEVPTLRMLALTADEVGRRAEAVLAQLPGLDIRIVDGTSRPGGGASPAGERPTRLLSLPARLERKLRAGDPPILGRLHEDRLLLDLRTVLPEEDAIVVRRLGDSHL